MVPTPCPTTAALPSFISAVWASQRLGKRGSIERCCGRVCRVFRRQRPPVCGWSVVVRQVARSDTATIVVALAAHQTDRPAQPNFTVSGMVIIPTVGTNREVYTSLHGQVPAHGTGWSIQPCVATHP